MFILNEKKYIEDVLASGKKPEDISIGYLIVLIAKYYHADYDKEDDLNKFVKEKISKFNIDGYEEYAYAKRIKDFCNALYSSEDQENDNISPTSKKKKKSKKINKSFREYEYIPIYKSELEKINTLPNDRQKKFMFTLYAIARYMNCNGWVNKKDSQGVTEIFKLANVSLTTDKKNELLYELHKNGYIYFGKEVNNLNIRVDMANDTDEIVYKITNFSNLGNQYIGNFKEGYKQCANPGCGRKIRITNNRKMYCSKCYKELNALDAKERMKKYREKGNVTF